MKALTSTSIFFLLWALLFTSCTKRLDVIAPERAGVYDSNAALASTKLHIATIKGTTGDNRFKIGNLIDDSLSTTWSTTNTIVATATLDSAQLITSIQLAVFTGNPSYKFMVQTSADSIVWNTVRDTTIAANKAGYQPFTLTASRAKHLRLLGYGNAGQWKAANSYQELQIWGSTITETPPPDTLPAVDSIFLANDARITWMGRIDTTNPLKPRFWQAGANLTFTFLGPNCSVTLNDQHYQTTNNSISIVVDGVVRKIRLTSFVNVVEVAKGLSAGYHTVEINKATEPLAGWLELVSIKALSLAPAGPVSTRLIGFFGDSQTVAFGADGSTLAPGQFFYDLHNAYMSFGARIARQLGAQYQLIACGGLAMVAHSQGYYTMPELWEFKNMWNNVQNRDGKYDVSKFPMQLAFITVGQNDDLSDSTGFVRTYIAFINTLKARFPGLKVIVASSPMADNVRSPRLKTLLQSVVKDQANVTYFAFSKRYYSALYVHPSAAENQLIAAEASSTVKSVMGW